MIKKKTGELEIGESVYLKTDPNKFERIITRIMISEGDVQYELALADSLSWHFEMEISRQGTTTPAKIEIKGLSKK